jgi:hypothetical protein
VKKLAVMIVMAAFSIGTFGAFAQSSDAVKPDATKSDKAKKAEAFAAKEKAMQDASRSSASGTSATPPTSEAKRLKMSGKDAMDSEMTLQKFKGSKPVDKNAQAQAPIKSLSKMTPEERAELRKEVVKEAKP